jgi:integrase
VKLLILLAPRKTALAAMRRSHLGDANNPTLWTTPFDLTKSRKSSTKKREYLTPLPPLAQRILAGVLKTTGRPDDRVFPSLPVHETAGGQATFRGVELKQRLVEYGAPADFEFHAWRHTLASWLEDQGEGEWERALVLNHSETGVTAGYSHGYPLDTKRQLLEKWADHVAALVVPEGTALLR